MKAGDRVRLLRCEDVDAPAPGTVGTVTFIDDHRTVFVDWDDGSKLGMIKNVDRFELVESIGSILTREANEAEAVANEEEKQ